MFVDDFVELNFSDRNFLNLRPNPDTPGGAACSLQFQADMRLFPPPGKRKEAGHYSGLLQQHF
jgi:hypothetical protein